MSFAINISKNIGKNICKMLSGKHSQNFGYSKQSATYVLKSASEKGI